ncbi:6-O-methylguanine DNA methyltransferase [Triangularia verruculosa]|uniref:Methylated-DNA--protein-cysteine methyltransferase n=1 Tax=Triangularia verruculosa TaxID=2587418 RepID=A0AAN7B0G4_9PEZI|nr:6-O-methylguanine DNA methyltransferase [Triangularia verruculosa]
MTTLTAPPTSAFAYASPPSLPSAPITTTSSTPQPTTQTTTSTSNKRKHPSPSPSPSLPNYPSLITHSQKITPFEKKVYHLLLTIPPGSFTTYALLSARLQSSPRAVGNALRKNPFAPGVPCHRVLSTGNTLGGFKGKISRKSADAVGGVDTLIEKKALLQKEGVRFDDKGRALGTPFRGFLK